MERQNSADMVKNQNTGWKQGHQYNSSQVRLQFILHSEWQGKCFNIKHSQNNKLYTATQNIPIYIARDHKPESRDNRKQGLGKNTQDCQNATKQSSCINTRGRGKTRIENLVSRMNQ